MSNKLVKIKEVITEGTFEGWLRDYEGNAHNPKISDLWVEIK